jgi:3-hydroxyacyl-[acyl-carrier-protein] dehydratase
MMMLDRVEEVTDVSALGWKNVTMNEPYFRGHFPNAPVMPGVLVMEALCQLVWIWSGAREVRMAGIQKLRFRHPVMPGDRLRLEIEQLEREESRCVVKATASVDGQIAVAGNLVFAMAFPGQEVESRG